MFTFPVVIIMFSFTCSFCCIIYPFVSLYLIMSSFFFFSCSSSSVFALFIYLSETFLLSFLFRLFSYTFSPFSSAAQVYISFIFFHFSTHLSYLSLSVLHNYSLPLFFSLISFTYFSFITVLPPFSMLVPYFVSVLHIFFPLFLFISSA